MLIEFKINSKSLLPAFYQKAFVLFRFQGQPIARVPKQAVLPAVSRVHFTRSNANVFYERWRPFFGSDIPERISSRSYHRLHEEGLLRRKEHSSQRQEVYQ
jgi:hypothetical protein